MELLLWHRISLMYGQLCWYLLVHQAWRTFRSVSTKYYVSVSTANCTETVCFLHVSIKTNSELTMAIDITTPKSMTSEQCQTQDQMTAGPAAREHQTWLTMARLCRAFGTISYYVQKLFSETQGVWYIDTSVTTPDSEPHDHGIAASATCQDKDCTQLAFKVTQLLCRMVLEPLDADCPASAACDCNVR